MKINQKVLEDRKVREEETKKAKVGKVEIVNPAKDSVLRNDFGEDDEESAIAKVRDKALRFDTRVDSLGGFKTGGAMTAGEFKTEMRKLGVRLTNKEISALVSLWDSGGSKTINREQFLSNFYKFRNVK